MALYIMPRYKYKIGVEDYDGEYIDGYFHGTGGPYLALMEFFNGEWVEADRWGCEGDDLVQQIQDWEDYAATNR